MENKGNKKDTPTKGYLFYCPAIRENPQVHRPYGVPDTTLTALGCVGLQPLKNLLSLQEYWKAPPPSRPRRQSASPTLMYLIYQGVH